MERKNFYVTVRSYIENLDDFGLTESTESDVTTEPCELRFADGGATVIYSVSSEGATAETELTVNDGGVRLVRRGAIDSLMEFSEGEVTKTVYCVPPYSFDAEIDTKKIRGSLGECGGTVELLYYLTIGGAKKKMRLSLTVSPR